jgi:hypothetical protein
MARAAHGEAQAAMLRSGRDAAEGESISTDDNEPVFGAFARGRNRPASDPRDFDTDLRVVDFLEFSLEFPGSGLLGAFVIGLRKILHYRVLQPRQDVGNGLDIFLSRYRASFTEKPHVHSAVPQPGDCYSDLGIVDLL